MARIVQLESEQKEFRIQEEVKATYSVNIINSEKFFQIDTYGKSTRVNNNVPSQVIQINKKTAIQLISILKEEFSI
ncbi:MAG: hypothetical protein ACYDEX_23595 [Mobilitalea sp.]